MNWEIITFIAYFVILLGVALVFYFNGTNKNSEDFFLGGRSMGPWVTALSAQASDMSATSGIDLSFRFRTDVDRYRSCIRNSC